MEMSIELHAKRRKLLNNHLINRFLYCLIIISLLQINSESKKSKRYLYNYDSEIRITFQKPGSNRFLSENYNGVFPSEIRTSGATTCNETSRLCDIVSKGKTITLIFNEPIQSTNNMFKGITNYIDEIDMSNFDSSKLVSMEYMFHGCQYLKNVNFGNMDTSLVQNMKGLFFQCFHRLESIDVSNFNTSLVTSMSLMFGCCHVLKSIKFSKLFNTSKVTSMQSMFYHGYKIISLDFSSFNTSLVTDMSNMFFECHSIKFLNLSNFNTSKVTTIKQMFYNCISLQYLDIKIFTFDNNPNKADAFKGVSSDIWYCIEDTASGIYLFNSDKYIICSETCYNEVNKKKDEVNNECVEICHNNTYDYNNFCYAECPNGTHIKKNTINICEEDECILDNKTLCIENTPKGYYFDTNDSYYKKCHENCINCYGEGNLYNNNCSECKPGLRFINDFDGIYNCYEPCPFYYYFDELNNYICTEDNKCPKKYNKMIFPKKKCIDECMNDFTYKYEFNEIYCFDKCPIGTINNDKNDICSIDINNNISQFNLTDPKDILTLLIQKSIKDGTYDYIINYIIENGVDYLQSLDYIYYQITTTDNQKNNNQTNLSIINLEDCENTLKVIYNINMSIPLIIFKIDYFIPGLLIPIVEYELYHPLNKSKLDMSYCNNTINISLPVSNAESDKDKHNPKSKYYTDKCYSYTTDDGTDIPIYDRKKEYIDNNLSLCEYNCYYINYETNNKHAECDCEMKGNIELYSDLMNKGYLLSNDFNISEDDLSYINIFECSNNLFTVNGLIKNISSYVLLFSFFFFILSSMMFMKCGYNFLIAEINKIINNKIEYQNQLTTKNNIFKGKVNDRFKNKNGKRFKGKNNPPRKSKKNIFSEEVNNNQNKSSKVNIKNNNNQLSLNVMNENATNKNNKIKTSTNLNKTTKSQLTTRQSINVKNKINKNNFKDCELNSFNYYDALLYDKRTFCQYYISLLKEKQHILFAFCSNNDYTSRIIKIDIFILSIDISYSINFVFFNHEKTIHKVYEDRGKYDLKYFLPFIAISFAITNIIIIIIKLIFLSDSNVLEIKKQVYCYAASKISYKVKRNIKIKYFIFFMLSPIFLAFFWFTLSTFGALYNNTQVLVFLNALISFGMSLIYPIFYNILPCIFRTLSLSSKESEIMYKFGKFLQHL